MVDTQVQDAPKVATETAHKVVLKFTKAGSPMAEIVKANGVRIWPALGGFTPDRLALVEKHLADLKAAVKIGQGKTKEREVAALKARIKELEG